MRVLVTGGAGFVGSHVADLLAAEGHEPLLLDALLPQAHGGGPPEADGGGPPDAHGGGPPDAHGGGPPGAHGGGPPGAHGGAPPGAHGGGPPDARGGVAPEHGGHELVRGDVRDADLLARLLPGVDAVCHQAAMVGHGVDPADAPAYAAHNDLGTAVLLAAMHAAGVARMVLAGSMVVYGEGRYDCPQHGVVRPGPRAWADLDAGRFEPRCPQCGHDLVAGLVGEDAPLDPRSTYAATKAAQEYLVAAWARQTGGAAWALRYHNVYGPRMPRDTPYAGVASIFRSALERGEAPRVLEDGGQRRDFVHVTDVAAANVRALTTDPPQPGLTPVNVCSGEPHTVADLARELAAAAGGPAPVVVGGARPGDVRHIVADPARARLLLGFRARVGFAEGVRAFATAPLRTPARLGQGGRDVTER